MLMVRKTSLASSIVFVCAAVLAAFLFASPWQAEAQVNPSVTFTAVDMDPTGNTCSSIGTVQQTLENVPLATDTTINVVVSGVPAGPSSEADNGGLYGTGFELIFDPAIVEVQAS